MEQQLSRTSFGQLWLSLLIAGCLITPTGFAQTTSTPLSYYLPKGVKYDPAIPTPDKILGFLPGDRHISHDQLFYYAKAISELSPRIHFEVMGYTYEQRPLVLLAITSVQNKQKLEEIRKEHGKLTDPAVSASVDINKLPAFVWLGHSIHGNEASGSNASVYTIYHLAAAQGPDIEKMLNEVVVFIDPSENPDGLHRFSTWVNEHRWSVFNADPQSREHNESWPGGRTNHYWFDLNRDWLPLQLPESQARIAAIQQWKPNILIDEHEQGTNATFHFSPGEPNRVHPLIPEENQQLTVKIAGYLAKGFDSVGSLYTSREGYDDFYNGRGPTYLDFNGGVAMLFEQASSRGYAQESDNGTLTFPFGVRNQFIGSLSVIRAGVALRKELLEYQRKYYQNNLSEGKAQTDKAWLFGNRYDKASAYHLAELLKRHGIDVYHLKENKTIKGAAYDAASSYLVPLAQPQYRLIQSIFEKRTDFKDSLFYDISGWTIPLAFNLDYTTLDAAQFTNGITGAAFDIKEVPAGKVIGDKASFAYLLEWNEYYAPKALYKLLDKGIIAKVANNRFTIDGVKAFARGTILVPVQNQSVTLDQLYDLINEVAAQSAGVSFYAVNTGSTTEGNHLGSNTFQRIQKPSVFILAGGRADGPSVGQVWHLLDTRYQIPGALINVESVAQANIDQYNTLVLVDGDYSNLPEPFVARLKTWVEAGNTIVAYERAINWLTRAGLLTVEFARQRTNDDGIYEDYPLVQRAAGIPGSVVEIKADLSHPLFYGYTKSNIPFWKSTALVIADTVTSKYNYPARFSASPLLSGYLPRRFANTLSKTPAVLVKTVSAGKVIAFTDDPNFRAYWYGTNRLLANSLFFGNLINPGTGR
jgi:hypothetical protein